MAAQTRLTGAKQQLRPLPDPFPFSIFNLFLQDFTRTGKLKTPAKQQTQQLRADARSNQLQRTTTRAPKLD
ncbi:hypothetical protein KY284_023075 [Solanum tuberosum]|nr:hypothetical protein KY284_023075 [Solanum tuberosum]